MLTASSTTTTKTALNRMWVTHLYPIATAQTRNCFNRQRITKRVSDTSERGHISQKAGSLGLPGFIKACALRKSSCRDSETSVPSRRIMLLE